MAENAIVRARISKETKEEAAAVLATMGLSVSDAFRMLMVRVAREKKLPFAPFVPNAETIAAIEEARRGDGEKFDSIDALMADLNADD